ncbi:GNAT family N-acetyltransferase [Streptococcus sp. zg-JUN1979]|uniref:GNAT family N-acetyltransferase n=1 Tax=Streptococcus sp. zg-JUN1979 TaxID=3391450 RepID=UPI0039A61EC4
MELRRPSKADEIAILEMIDDFQRHDSSMDGAWHIDMDSWDYDRWLESNQAQEMGFNGTPAIQFVAFDGQNPVGFVHLRLRLTESLRHRGGHIGYSTRPTERGRGYAKKMLALALDIASQKNIKQALLTCHEKNEASRRVILANGGLLETKEAGIERYWIPLERINDETSKMEHSKT